MQVSMPMLAVALELYVLLLLAAIFLVLYVIKQKKLLRQQQGKLQELIATIQNSEAPAAAPAKSYKQLLNEQLEHTQDRFALIAPRSDIAESQSVELPINQRIVALRYAFLRAEELGTTEVQGSEGYWNIFRETLEPFLQTPSESTAEDGATDELDMYKKRVENLEKFKKLFFDLEKRWNEAQETAQGYYNELYSMADGIEDKERYEQLLGQYSESYNDISRHINTTNAAITGRPIDNKTINIIRQDPRAAEEIMKLRNVAADQYRVIGNLQRQLDQAVTAEEKDLAIKALGEQLQRQVRFVQESDTCVQLLEEELNKAHEQLAQQTETLGGDNHFEEENQRIKETLHSFTQESKELLGNIEDLEKENDDLKNSHEKTNSTTNSSSDGLQKIQTEFTELRKQYAELEEKYLELKLK